MGPGLRSPLGVYRGVGDFRGEVSLSDLLSHRSIPLEAWLFLVGPHSGSMCAFCQYGYIGKLEGRPVHSVCFANMAILAK